MMIINISETNSDLVDLKNDMFTLKYCSCGQKGCQEALEAQYSFGKLGGYKGLYCNKYYETQI